MEQGPDTTEKVLDLPKGAGEIPSESDAPVVAIESDHEDETSPAAEAEGSIHVTLSSDKGFEKMTVTEMTSSKEGFQTEGFTIITSVSSSCSLSSQQDEVETDK